MDSVTKWLRINSRIQALEEEIDRLKHFEKKPIRTDVLDHGYVTLYDWMGDDLRTVNMARQSFGQESTEIGAKERGLINFLMRERHGTPFEGPVFTFNIKCPIFVVREWMRHRIGSFNEYSGRYTKMISDFYIPAPEQVRTQKGKPGNYTFEPVEDETVVGTTLDDIQFINKEAWKAYNLMLKGGVAKEVARMILPVNIYTMFTWVINLRALLNFISLRSHASAMWEIRQYSEAIEEQIKTIVPVAFEAFIENGEVAP